MLKASSLAKWGAAVLLLSSLSSCEDILEQYFPKPTPPPTIPTFPPLGQDIAFYALSGGDKLDAYSTANAATRTSSVAITGLSGGETLLAIDFRPATGQLYGVSSGSRLYVINQNTGAARAIGAGPFSPAVGGNLVGFDFNPTVDRIRLVTSTGQNLRLNPETGAVAATDGVLNGAAGATITGAAYTNNTAGATTTVLYDLDPATDQLYRQDPPNNGTLVPVGNLNLNISGNGGFDIDAKTGTALGLYSVSGKPTLFTLDLATGAARPLAQYAANLGYSGIAIPTRPVAYVLATQSRGPRLNESHLVIFDPTNPVVTVSRLITGLLEVEILSGLDLRPINGQLYAVSSFNRLYTLNAASGEATLVAAVRGANAEIANGFDFDPIEDRIRLVSYDGYNARINPLDGAGSVDKQLNPGLPYGRAAAYSNNYAGTTTTTLYVIGQDATNNSGDSIVKLYRESSPTTGTLVAIGELGNSQPFADIQFDIAGTSNTAYALTNDERLYTIDLLSGTPTPIGTLDLRNAGLQSFYNKRGLTIGLGF